MKRTTAESVAPCPFCGSAKLYVGHTGSGRLGVQCEECGAALSREYPEHWPKNVRRLPADKRLKRLDELVLAEAVAAWNLRAVHA